MVTESVLGGSGEERVEVWPKGLLVRWSVVVLLGVAG